MANLDLRCIRFGDSLSNSFPQIHGNKNINYLHRHMEEYKVDNPSDGR